jgi:hypothetical protein
VAESDRPRTAQSSPESLRFGKRSYSLRWFSRPEITRGFRDIDNFREDRCALIARGRLRSKTYSELALAGKREKSYVPPFHADVGQRPKLNVFLKHGEVPLDNNRCENAIRPFVIGRKGWMFSDTIAGAKASANLFSLVETCKANGIEPHGYLSSLFA